MNKIRHLLDEKYVLDLFKKEVLPLYPCFLDIEKIKIRIHKNNIWQSTYHVVFEYITFFAGKRGETKKISIFCSAHSDEPRKNVFYALKYLRKNGFATGSCTIPRALFYSEEFRAIFYRGAHGRNLYHFIRNKEKDEIKKLIPKASRWFAKLHKLKTENAQNFNEQNSLIKKVVPGVDHILETIKNDYPKYLDFYKKAYAIFVNIEENFLNSTKQRWLVHGDAHPENIIKVSEKEIAMVDFTDLCLADFARDLGSFAQQLDFMLSRHSYEKDFIKKMKKSFLDNYLLNAKIKLDKELQKRIDNYYNWTMMRTATFFLTKYESEPERALPLIDNLKNKLSI